ncbi:dihydrofolate reductase family protein [Demequina muriae]|uniref:Dihydrofolate reductase family protein n=1 Tax=Demequina muriae TaxID=3051664 RepID=A0ABT8GJK3_9MICO|nr:dihydrofolate reductase family protein [Demequina sp. EGI L300058]MDN4481605.1 dihydrofolate reductase family protein [Demequina sp. EGI L300058]
MTEPDRATTLRRIEPAGDDIAPDPAEGEMRALYAHRPGTVRLGLIRSRDGRCAGPDGSSGTLTGPEDLRILRTLRSVADVVLVGAQTARRERYGDIDLPAALTATRTSLRAPRPHLAIVTRSGILPPGLTPATTWIVTVSGSRAAALGGPWASQVIEAGGTDISPRTLLRELGSRGLTRVLCEGGPTLAARMLERGLIDEFCVTTADVDGDPGAKRVPDVPARLRLAHRLAGGPFEMERWVAPR